MMCLVYSSSFVVQWIEDTIQDKTSCDLLLNVLEMTINEDKNGDESLKGGDNNINIDEVHHLIMEAILFNGFVYT